MYCSMAQVAPQPAVGVRGGLEGKSVGRLRCHGGGRHVFQVGKLSPHCTNCPHTVPTRVFQVGTRTLTVQTLREPEP